MSPALQHTAYSNCYHKVAAGPVSTLGLQRMRLGAGEMAPWFITLVALAEDPASAIITHMGVHIRQ